MRSGYFWQKILEIACGRVLTSWEWRAKIALSVYGHRLPHTVSLGGGSLREEDFRQRRGLHRLSPLRGVLPGGAFPVEGPAQGFQEGIAPASAAFVDRGKEAGLLQCAVLPVQRPRLRSRLSDRGAPEES